MIEQTLISNLKHASAIERPVGGFPYLGCAYRGSFPLVEILGSIPGIALLSYSSAGCDADFIQVESHFRRLSAGHQKTSPRLFSAEIGHADVVLGTEARLRNAVDELVRRYSPQAIFIRAKCCTAGRSATEVQEEIRQLRRHHSLPILLARCDSLDRPRYRRHPLFPDPAWASLPLRRARSGTFFNRIGFGRDQTFAQLLEKSGLPWNPLELGAPWENFEQSGAAQLSFGYSTVEFGNQWGSMLERECQIPFQSLCLPYGFEGTGSALVEVGRLTGTLVEMRQLARSEEKRWGPEWHRLRAGLRGMRVLPLVVGHWGDEAPMLRLLRELGIVIPGLPEDGCHWTSLRNDLPQVDSFYGETGIGIGHVGGYQLLNLVREVKPDAVVAMHNGIAPWCARMGIPVLEIRDPRQGLPFQSYEGLIRLGRRLLSLRQNPALFRTLSRQPHIPYRQQWLDFPLVQENS
ncbi:MAG TPA: nitrogenase component 1 [Fibrobacteraceae bacterium]|nr:nitrogenase component 1 [Fibrobacteraceae bacterium]